MESRVSPDIEKIFEQLLWIMRRRFRVVESVKAHFGKTGVDRALAGLSALPPLPLDHEPEFLDLLDEREPLDFLGSLSFAVEHFEADTITRLRAHVSMYRDHVDEQILFGARTAGQEAARTFLESQAPIGRPRLETLSVPESVQAVFELGFAGLPGDRNHFLVLRPRGGCSAHFVRSPHLAAWAAAGADARFLYGVRCEWVRGMLDILSPSVNFHPAHSIEQGESYGLEHFYLRETHAGP
jgi:hypothetical protein